MAAKTLWKVEGTLPSVRQNVLPCLRVNLKLLTRTISAVLKCNYSQAVTQVKPQKQTSAYEQGEKLPVISGFENRNPRNPEYFGYNKPRGYTTQHYRRDFYNKLKFVITNRHSKGYVIHNSGTVLASASTTEFEITRHLYKTADISAARNVGRVLAQRCQEAGVTRVFWEPQYGDKKKLRVRAFFKAIQRGGVQLNEPRKVIAPETFYTTYRPKKRKTNKQMPYSLKRKGP